MNTILPATVEHKNIKKEYEDDMDDGFESVDSDFDFDLNQIEQAFVKNADEVNNKRKNKDQPDKAKKKKKIKQFAIQKTSFKKLVKEVLGHDKAISQKALFILRTVAEQELIQFFEKTQIVACLNKRKTVCEADVKVVKALSAKNFFDLKKILENK
jgi:histone H3/H4